MKWPCGICTAVLLATSMACAALATPGPSTQPGAQVFERSAQHSYFPSPESQGGWRTLQNAAELQNIGVNPDRRHELQEWLLGSDNRNFAAVVVHKGHVVLEVERGNSARTDSRRVASVSKAICATVLAIAAEKSQQGLTPKKMQFDDLAFGFIPWAQPLSDPRKAKITIKQLLNHTSGLCPEATGAPNDGAWEYVLGHTGDERTAKLAFPPGGGCGYSTHALAHAALVCETVTGKPYDEFAIEALFKPLGVEHWWFQYYDGGQKYGRHPSHGLGLSARDLARIAYCMLRGGSWNEEQVIPKWFVDETAAPTHQVTSPELRWKINPQVFSHGWELPARHWAEGGRNGKGIPADARSKPGSGGQLIAFVPSLDLVVTRQTGSSGDWGYEEYLRRACAVVSAEGRAPGNIVFPGSNWESASAESQGVDATKLSAAMEYLGKGLRDYGGTGTVFIVRNGRQIWAGPDCDRENQIFSATKSFTSTLFGLLIQDGKASLETLAQELEPSLKELYPGVTLRHFATMTSGYDSAGSSYEIDEQGRGDSWNPGPPAPPIFPPGSRFRYWDDAMMQFGNLLTKAAGEPLDRLFRKRIAQPIGMSKWRWTQNDTPSGKVLSWTGGICTSSRELARFGHLFLNRGKWNGEQLINTSWVEQATSVQVPATIPNDKLPRSRGAGVYGYNWWVNGVKPDGLRLWPGAPPRTFYANGLHNNVCIVVPEWNVVIARTNGAREDGSVSTPPNVNEVWNGFCSLLAQAIVN